MFDYIFIPLLIVVTMGSGILVYAFPSLSSHHFSYVLAFAGSYLFSTAIVHLIPELFEKAHDEGVTSIGIYLLIGFFLQFFLDVFGGSVAHGHLAQGGRSSISLVVALCLHAFIEGIILPKVDFDVWIAIMLHKLPAAFTLTSFLYINKQSRLHIFLALFLFAIAAPLGCVVYGYCESFTLLSSYHLIVINALATGTLFHIASTILFESNPHHKIGVQQVLFVILGAMGAILIHYFLH